MPNYSYVAIDAAGKEKKGSMESSDPAKVTSTLRGQGMIPIEVKEQSVLDKDISFSLKKRVKGRDLSMFCRQFVSIINAGVTIIDALGMLSEQTSNKEFSKAIKEVQVGVQKGETLANSMRQRKDIFPMMLITLVEAGEASGSLDISLTRMAIQFEKDTKMSGLVKKAMIYPIIVMLVAVIVVIVMLTFVVPSYMTMFADLDMELPVITKIVVAMSNFIIKKWWLLLIIVVVAVIGIKIFKGSKEGEYFFSKLGLKIPMLANFTVKNSSSRFARTMSTLTYSGIGLAEALDITSNTMGNRLFKDALLEAKDEVLKGVPLSEPIKECGLFPPMVYHMIGIGEQTGDMESMLEKLADYYDEEVEVATQSLIAAMEPMIILVLAAIVGFIIAAVLSPMLSLYQNLDKI